MGAVAAQARLCIEFIRSALGKAGSSLHKVVQMRVILTDIDNRKAAIDVRKKYFKGFLRVETLFVIKRFVNPACLAVCKIDTASASLGENANSVSNKAANIRSQSFCLNLISHQRS